MQYSKLNIILLILLPSFGFILGRYSVTPTNQISDSKTTVNIVKSIKNTPQQKERTSETHNNSPKEIKEQNDIEMNEIDEYDQNLKHEESLNAWNESIDFFFKNNFENNSDQLQKEYLILKDKLKKELDKEWEIIQEKAKVGDNEFFFNTTYQQDLNRMKIRSKYHQKLKNILGTENYEKLQRKIEKCKVNQVRMVRENLAHGHCPNF